MEVDMKGFMTAAGLGAGLMFLLDPDRGPRRRALIRDKFTKVNNDVEDWVSGMAKDLSNRVHGIRAELESKWRSDEAVTDEQLVARIRARLGHLVSHPRAIDVRVENGVLTISGPVLSHEAGRLLSGVSHVRGIRKVRAAAWPMVNGPRPAASCGAPPVRRSSSTACGGAASSER
jgi:hypothetical protein